MPDSTYPAKLALQPMTLQPTATVRVPGSKSITNRAFVLAAIGSPNGCRLTGVLESEDTEVMMHALQQLGFRIEFDRDNCTATIASSDTGALIPNREAELYLANSGTSMRFLTAMLALGNGRYRLDGVPRMRERPIQDLLDALNQLGATAWSEGHNGCPPVVMEPMGMVGGKVRIRGDVSSQYLSGLLMVAPFATGDVVIDLEGRLVSEPYVDMTLTMMRQWGLRIERLPRLYRVPGNQKGQRTHYAIEPDASAASYFFALAAIHKTCVIVDGLTLASLQGDIQFVRVLEQMGCHVEGMGTQISVEGRGILQGIDIDMNAISDTVMTLGAVACFAKGPTTIRNVGHIRHKETDRLTALANELRKVGATVEEGSDWLRIIPGKLRGASIATYDDHRMAMSMALIGTRVPGVVIENPGCVAKTYPRFFDDLARLRM